MTKGQGWAFAALVSLAMWYGIIVGILLLAGCAGPGDERLVRCQRAAPPWATGECPR